MSGREVLDWDTEAEDPLYGFQTEYQGESKLSTSIHLPGSWLQIHGQLPPIPALPRHNWLSPQTVSQNNPFLPWFLQVTFVRHVVTTLRKWLTVSFSIFLTEFLEASKSQSIETRERLSGHLMKPESSVVLLFLSPDFPFTVLSFPANSPLLYYDIRIPPFIQHSSFSS